MDELLKTIISGTPVHFYGPGLGKSTMCNRLRELGYENVTECGDDAICNDLAERSIPEKFTGMLVYFEENPAGVNLPDLMEFIGLAP